MIPGEIRSRLVVGARDLGRYGDREIWADTDLHDRAAEILKERVEVGRRVIDLGCGKGAFATRLADSGMDVLGVDVLAPAEVNPIGFKYAQVDLDDPAARSAFAHANAGAFDVLCLLEVIEHVHDPWATIGLAAELLSPGGLLLLSTPNVASFYSRFRFFTSGHFHQFEPSDLSYGHINPMTPLMIAVVLTQSGFRLLEDRPGPPVPVLVWDRGISSLPRRMFHAVAWLTSALLSPLMRGGGLRGWSRFYVAERLSPQEVLPS